LTKSFGSVRALVGVDLDLRAGAIHGLVGANGAGKSTLLRILAGAEQPDDGLVLLDGKSVILGSPRDSRRLGMSFIHQELNLVPKFSAEQNMGLEAVSATRLGFVDRKARSIRAMEVADRLHFDFPLSRAVEKLTVAQRWMVSIGRALMGSARVAAMDEPTASLSQDETDALFGILHRLAEEGVAILYVTHRLAEVMAICDYVTVLKDGRVQADLSMGSYSQAKLIAAITGDVTKPSEVAAVHGPVGPVLLNVKHISRLPRVRDVSFSLHRGEVLGLAGLVGSGRTEIARILFGADQPDGGSMELDGRRYAPRSTHEAVRASVSLVPEERRSQGLFLLQNLTFNLNLASWDLTRTERWPHFLDIGRARRRAIDVCEQLHVKASSPATKVKILSGGNQQKIVIGKWLARSSKVFLLDEPTRGVDVGTRAEIYRIIRGLAESGMGVVVISSELDELRICDRVLIVVEGEIVGGLDGCDINEADILRIIYTQLAKTEDTAAITVGA
jgi:ABC-type sugar transport system ATPase subunit